MSSAAQTKPVDFTELEKTVAAELKENKTPGASVVTGKISRPRKRGRTDSPTNRAN
jgi:hypothetical protein